MFIAQTTLSETSSVRSGMATEPPAPTSFRSLAMSLLTELGSRTAGRFYKHGTPTELNSPASFDQSNKQPRAPKSSVRSVILTLQCQPGAQRRVQLCQIAALQIAQRPTYETAGEGKR